MTPRTSDPAVIEHRLLDLAYTTDSVITVAIVAYYTPCSIQDAERVLDRLATEGRLVLESDEDGNLHYVMPNRQKLAPPHALVRQVDPQLATTRDASPALAAVLSLVVPGAGQLYAGRPLAAVGWFLVVSLGYLMLVVPGLLLHLLCVASAAGAAARTRRSLAA